MEDAYARVQDEMSAARGEVARLSSEVVGQLESDRRASGRVRRQLQTASDRQMQLQQELNDSAASFEATAAGHTQLEGALLGQRDQAIKSADRLAGQCSELSARCSEQVSRLHRWWSEWG